MIRQFPTIRFLWRNRTCLLLAQQPHFNISSSTPPQTAFLGTPRGGLNPPLDLLKQIQVYHFSGPFWAVCHYVDYD